MVEGREKPCKEMCEKEIDEGSVVVGMDELLTIVSLRALERQHNLGPNNTFTTSKTTLSSFHNFFLQYKQLFPF